MGGKKKVGKHQKIFGGAASQMAKQRGVCVAGFQCTPKTKKTGKALRELSTNHAFNCGRGTSAKCQLPSDIVLCPLLAAPWHVAHAGRRSSTKARVENTVTLPDFSKPATTLEKDRSIKTTGGPDHSLRRHSFHYRRVKSLPSLGREGRRVRAGAQVSMYRFFSPYRTSSSR